MAYARTVHLIPNLGRGGVQQVISTLISGVEDQNELIGTAGGDGIKDLEKLGIHWIRIPLFPSTPLNAVRSFIVLKRVIRKYEIGMIHSHHRFSSLVGRAVAKAMNIPIVSTVHDLADGRRFISRVALGNVVIVFSRAVSTHLIERFGVKPEYIHRVPMGIPSVAGPTHAQILETKRQMGCTPLAPIVGFVGRLSREKAPDVFLQAAQKVVSSFPDCRFFILGDGEMRCELESLCRNLGISENVSFLGWQDDVTLFISCADFVVITSLREGFGRVVIESFMLRKPVIATRVGGLTELVQHKQNGLLVPPGKSSNMAEAIKILLEDRELQQQMGNTAYDRVQGRFSLEAMLRGVNLVYLSVLKRH